MEGRKKWLLQMTVFQDSNITYEVQNSYGTKMQDNLEIQYQPTTLLVLFIISITTVNTLYYLGLQRMFNSLYSILQSNNPNSDVSMAIALRKHQIIFLLLLQLLKVIYITLDGVITIGLSEFV
jgi:hypothetical protein